MRCLTRVGVEGPIERIPREGPLIIASNHLSNADGVIVGGWLTPALGRRIHWLGKREMLEWPILGTMARHGSVHPIDRGGADVEAFRLAQRILDEGHVLVVFPEGTRSTTGGLQEAKDGLALLALRSGAPILPVGVYGTDRFWPRGRICRARRPCRDAGRRGVQAVRRRPRGRGPRDGEAARHDRDHDPHRGPPAGAPPGCLCRCRGGRRGRRPGARDARTARPPDRLRGHPVRYLQRRWAPSRDPHRTPNRLLLWRPRGDRQGQGGVRGRQDDPYPRPGRPQRGRHRRARGAGHPHGRDARRRRPRRGRRHPRPRRPARGHGARRRARPRGHRRHLHLGHPGAARARPARRGGLHDRPARHAPPSGGRRAARASRPTRSSSTRRRTGTASRGASGWRSSARAPSRPGSSRSSPRSWSGAATSSRSSTRSARSRSAARRTPWTPPGAST